MKEEVKKHYKNIAGNYSSELNKYCQDRFVQFIDRYIKKGDMILDVGCGDGYIMDKIKVKPKSGIDISLEMVKLNRNKNVRCADAESLPFEDESFDVVYSVDLLEHVPNPKKAIKEAYRVLRPNGRIIAITPNGDIGWLLELLDKLKLKLPEGPHKFLKSEELRKIIIMNNFNILVNKKIVLFPKDVMILTQLFEYLEKVTPPLCFFHAMVGIKK